MTKPSVFYVTKITLSNLEVLKMLRDNYLSFDDDDYPEEYLTYANHNAYTVEAFNRNFLLSEDDNNSYAQRIDSEFVSNHELVTIELIERLIDEMEN